MVPDFKFSFVFGQFMPMEVFVWIFYKISGVLYMMWQLYVRLSKYNITFYYCICSIVDCFVLIDLEDIFP
jgi:hypothetical protein